MGKIGNVLVTKWSRSGFGSELNWLGRFTEKHRGASLAAPITATTVGVVQFGYVASNLASHGMSPIIFNGSTQVGLFVALLSTMVVVARSIARKVSIANTNTIFQPGSDALYTQDELDQAVASATSDLQAKIDLQDNELQQAKTANENLGAENDSLRNYLSTARSEATKFIDQRDLAMRDMTAAQAALRVANEEIDKLTTQLAAKGNGPDKIVESLDLIITDYASAKDVKAAAKRFASFIKGLQLSEIKAQKAKIREFWEKLGLQQVSQKLDDSFIDKLEESDCAKKILAKISQELFRLKISNKTAQEAYDNLR